MRGFLQALVAALSLAALAGAAAAQDSDERRVRGYLEHGLQRHAALGFAAEPMVPDLATPLRMNRPFLWSVYLVEGTTYRIYGACDDDCADLDMEVYGNDGNLLDRDTARDDTPYVQITPTRSGRAYVRIWLYSCRADPCYVAARVTSGGTPAEREPDDIEGGVSGELEYAQEPAHLAAVAAALDAEEDVAAGYRALPKDAVAPMLHDEVGRRVAYALEAHRYYVIQAACDQDCGDVDLAVFDPSGNRVGNDRPDTPAGRPRVTLRAEVTGEYFVRVRLLQCADAFCYVGVRVYEAPS